MAMGGESTNVLVAPQNQMMDQLQRQQNDYVNSRPEDDPLMATSGNGHDSDGQYQEGMVLQVEGPRFMEAQTPMMKVDSPEIGANLTLKKEGADVDGTTVVEAKLVKDVIEQDEDETTRTSITTTSTIEDWQENFQRKLYDRPVERLALLEAYQSIIEEAQHGDRVSFSGSGRFDSSFRSSSELSDGSGGRKRRARMILISGQMGTGKTFLARKTLQPQVTEDGGYFLVGKFDQLERPEPFSAVVHALTQYTHLVLQQDEALVAQVRTKILNALGGEISVLIGMIPSIGKIVGTSERTAGSGAGHAGLRSMGVLKTFLSAIASPERPIVFVFDDLHYADLCSLRMIKQIVTHSNAVCPGSVVVVATCLNTIPPESRLSTVLREMEDAHDTDIINIHCGDMKCGVLKQLVTDTFQLPEEQSIKVCKTICHQTSGRLLYVMEFMKWLQDEGIIRWNNGKWTWDQQDLCLSIDWTKKGDFITDRLEHYPLMVKEVLKVAACLGATVNTTLLSLIVDAPVDDHLLFAAGKGVLLRVAEVSGVDSYQFPADGMQKAAYNLIPDVERVRFHLDVGRKLLSRLSKEELETHLYTVVGQMKIGAPLLKDQTEKHAIAMLCLQAGKNLARSSAFRASSEYLLFGISLLTERRWLGKESELCLALYNAATEVLVCISDFEKVDELLEETFKNTRHCCEKLQARCTQIYSLGLRDRQQEAIDKGVEVLEQMGVPFPRRMCSARLLSEMKQAKQSLRGKSDEQLMRLPHMTEFKSLMAMRILSIVSLDCMVTRPKLFPFLALKMVNLTMEYGLCEHSSLAFALYGILCMKVKEKMNEGYQYGNLALKLLDMYKMDEYLPRVHAAVYGKQFHVIHSFRIISFVCLNMLFGRTVQIGIIAAWKKPVKDTLEPLMRAHQVGKLTGDMEFASLCANLYCFNKFWAGPSLDIVEKDFKRFNSWMRSQKQETGLRMSEPCLHLLQVLTGKIEDPTNTAYLDAQMEHAAKTNNSMACAGVAEQKIMIGYLFNDCGLGRDEVFQEFEDCPTPDFSLVLRKTFQALYFLRLARSGHKKRQCLRQARKILRWMQEMSEKSPHNFADKALLVEAELLSVLGKSDKAYEKYTVAIAMAAASEFTCIHAIALERVAWHVFRQPNADVAQAESYFNQASEKYEQWGAHGKVEDLKNEVASIFGHMKF